MIFRLSGGAENSERLRVGPGEEVGAHGAGGRRAQAGHRNVVRQLSAGYLADNNCLELAFGCVIEHDDRVIEPRVFLMLGKRFNPSAMWHEPGGAGRGNSPLMDADANSARDVNASPRRVEPWIFAPPTESRANGLDGGLHTDDASDLFRSNQQ